ncbi:hypothetical protein LZ578_08710 [Jeotgalibaca sp. MA1X17-3]|uniref:hypothetical protein n=1 Tax=Jeotgalibaca sp. MA1X17-3 TaxID=2908211 RepID=UPI001F3D57C9|nr:hypothetical protein [Jeotgalibaca sp. MA1X17-3]UJF15079.1 hypothetical protein LZ578_08710 [Jeotgalibaca sp. MA1X17-3]
MKLYIVKVGDNFLKSFRMNRDGRLKIYYANKNESMFFTTEKENADKVSNLIGGKTMEVTE